MKRDGLMDEKKTRQTKCDSRVDVLFVKSQTESVKPLHYVIQTAWLTALNLTLCAPAGVRTACGDTPAMENKRLHTMDSVNESVMWFSSSHFTHLNTPPTDTDWNSCHLMVLRKQTTHRILLSSESNFSSNCERQIKLWFSVSSPQVGPLTQNEVV